MATGRIIPIKKKSKAETETDRTLLEYNEKRCRFQTERAYELVIST